MGEHGLTLVTCGGAGEARDIAHQLVEAGLAAGIQVVPIESVYRWEGEIVEDEETLLIVKTRSDRFEAVRSMVEQLHSYQVPPILMIPIDQAHQPYLDWIDSVVQPDS